MITDNVMAENYCSKIYSTRKVVIPTLLIAIFHDFNMFAKTRARR